MSRRVIMAVGLVLCIISISFPCCAWLFDGGTPGSGFSLNSGSNLTWAAAPFVIKYDCYVDTIGVALSRLTASTSFSVYLSTSLQNVESSSIAHWTIAPTGPVLQYYYTDLGSPILLTGNKAYGLVVMPSSTDSYGAIASSNKGYLGYLSSNQGASWYQQAVPFAIRVDGTAVPEPGAILVLTIGLVAVRGKLRQK